MSPQIEPREDLPALADSRVGRIPVRNLWLLMLYASDLFRSRAAGEVGIEDLPDEIPDLVGEILADAAERRMRRRLTYGYQPAKRIQSRVRGRIDGLTTERKKLLARGLIACQFEDLTIDTARNQLVRAALEVISTLVKNPKTSHRCWSLARSMKSLGVSACQPTRQQMSLERFGRHDLNDRLVVHAARLALDLALPTEDAGTRALPLPSREEVWARKLFERAVGGFYQVFLDSSRWTVRCGWTLSWQVQEKTAGIDDILPTMRTDIVLDDRLGTQRIVIDTKFNAILTKGWHRDETLRSGYLYQMYAYLRSQVGKGDSYADGAIGLLLHPSIGDSIDETVRIQGHPVRFATVDLTASTRTIREQLSNVIRFLTH